MNNAFFLGILLMTFIVISNDGYGQDTITVIIRNKKQINNLCVSEFKEGIYYAGSCNNIKNSDILMEFDNLFCYDYMIFKFKNGKYFQEGYKCSEYDDGYIKCYHSNGRVKSEGVFYFNNKIGLWKYYNKRGEIIKTEDFSDENKVLGLKIRYPSIVHD